MGERGGKESSRGICNRELSICEVEGCERLGGAGMWHMVGWDGQEIQARSKTLARLCRTVCA